MSCIGDCWSSIAQQNYNSQFSVVCPAFPRLCGNFVAFVFKCGYVQIYLNLDAVRHRVFYFFITFCGSR